MPVYDYQCSSCGNTFEATQRMSDPPLTTCACGSEGTVTRLLSAGSGLIFKGSGFYITDYKNGKNGSTSSTTPNSTPSSSEGTAKSGTASKAEAPATSTTSSCAGGGCGRHD